MIWSLSQYWLQKKKKATPLVGEDWRATRAHLKIVTQTLPLAYDGGSRPILCSKYTKAYKMRKHLKPLQSSSTHSRLETRDLSPYFFFLKSKDAVFGKPKVPTVHLLTRTQRVSMGSGRTSRECELNKAARAERRATCKGARESRSEKKVSKARAQTIHATQCDFKAW